MKQSEISFDEINIFSRPTEHVNKKRKISENNSNSCYLIIILLKLLLILVINLYQTIKIERKNKIFSKFFDYLNSRNNFSYAHKNLNNINFNFLDNRKHNFLEKLMKKLIKTNNIMVLYNYMELDNLFKDDKRYDEARNCLVQPEFNSSFLYKYLNTKKVKERLVNYSVVNQQYM